MFRSAEHCLVSVASSRRERPCRPVQSVRPTGRRPTVVVAGDDPALPLLRVPLGLLDPTLGFAWWPCGSGEELGLASVRIPDSGPRSPASGRRDLGRAGGSGNCEPLNGLDPDGIRWIRGLLRSLAAGDRTVLISSHLLSELAPIADDVVVMSRGRLVAQATLSELFFDLVRKD
jgi:hypothetical protein